MLRKIKDTIKVLLKSNTAPKMIALGISLGVFIGVIPIYGLHSFLAVILALVIPRANKIALLLGANISLPPVIPFITWAGYEIGRLVLPKNYPPLNLEYFRNFSLQKLCDFYFPLFIGSLILAFICAVAFYFAALYLAEALKERRKCNES